MKQSIKNKINTSEFHKHCVITGLPPEQHHALIYNGKQVDEEWAIIPLSFKYHRGENGHINKRAKDLCELFAIIRGYDELIKNYPKFNWEQRKKYLISKFI